MQCRSQRLEFLDRDFAALFNRGLVVLALFGQRDGVFVEQFAKGDGAFAGWIPFLSDLEA